MTSHLQTLEEQAQFDRDEKDVLFAEEVGFYFTAFASKIIVSPPK